MNSSLSDTRQPNLWHVRLRGDQIEQCLGIMLTSLVAANGGFTESRLHPCSALLAAASLFSPIYFSLYHFSPSPFTPPLSTPLVLLFPFSSALLFNFLRPVAFMLPLQPGLILANDDVFSGPVGSNRPLVWNRSSGPFNQPGLMTLS